MYVLHLSQQEEWGTTSDDEKLGLMGQETIELIKKGFPELADVEPERFDFQIYNDRCSWVTVMEEAWELLSRDPPSRWVIKVRDTPEEMEQRKPDSSHLSSYRARIRQTDRAGMKVSNRGNKQVFLTLQFIVNAITIVTIACKLGFYEGSIWGKIKYTLGASVVQAVVQAVIGGISVMYS